VYCAVNTLHFGYKNQSLKLYKAKVAVCSEIRTKHKLNVGTTQKFLMLNLMVRKVTARV
jgi:hypothetical protein